MNAREVLALVFSPNLYRAVPEFLTVKPQVDAIGARLAALRSVTSGCLACKHKKKVLREYGLACTLFAETVLRLAAIDRSRLHPLLGLLGADRVEFNIVKGMPIILE